MLVFIIQRFSAIALVGDPLWKVIDIGFLIAVLSHALAGTYSMLMDMEQVTPMKRILAGVLIGLWIVGLVYGTYTIISFQPPASLLAAH
jgi:succinate dehydrogenase hydrophobic anchor subunit